jgi:hypothetical protein
MFRVLPYFPEMGRNLDANQFMDTVAYNSWWDRLLHVLAELKGVSGYLAYLMEYPNSAYTSLPPNPFIFKGSGLIGSLNSILGLFQSGFLALVIESPHSSVIGMPLLRECEQAANDSSHRLRAQWESSIPLYVRICQLCDWGDEEMIERIVHLCCECDMIDLVVDDWRSALKARAAPFGNVSISAGQGVLVSGVGCGVLTFDVPDVGRSVVPPVPKAPSAPAVPAPKAPHPSTDDIFECPICNDGKKNTALGCGHVLCNVCAAQLNICPNCRVPITQRTRIYLT